MAKDIVKRLVIGFGFFNGLWLAVGINPEEEIIAFLQPTIAQMPEFVKTVFVLIPILLTIITIITIFFIYARGGLLGAGAVVLAFFAGAIIFKMWWISLVLLVVAYIIGVGAFRRRGY